MYSNTEHKVIVDGGWGDRPANTMMVDQLAHSLPYVKPEEGFSYGMYPPTSTQHRSLENIVKQSSVMVRPPVDVLATYVNTSDKRSLKADLLDAHEKLLTKRRFSSTSSVLSVEARDKSGESSGGEWGWFADIDSSSESSDMLPSLRRKYSNDQTRKVPDGHVLCDESENPRITAAHKTFAWREDEEDGGEKKIVSAAISIPKFRIVQSKNGSDRHAQYQVTLKLGNSFFTDWRRYSEFANLIKEVDPAVYQRTHLAWRNIDSRWFNRLEPSYLHRKCITLENFLRELMYESLDPTVLLNFLGGSASKVHVKCDHTRPSAQLPKDLRPPQPQEERELFEKLWAENFKRSQVENST